MSLFEFPEEKSDGREDVAGNRCVAPACRGYGGRARQHGARHRSGVPRALTKGSSWQPSCLW